MVMRTLLLAMLVLGQGERVERDVLVVITGPDLRGGAVSQLLWHDDEVLIQGVFASEGGLAPIYFVAPTRDTGLRRLTGLPDGSLAAWRRQSSRVSPTGLGTITTSADTALPMYGVGPQEQRLSDAVSMGGTASRHTVRLGRLVLHERTGTPPYDGEVWAWSSARVNRVAWVDGKGDLWIAEADGRHPRRLLRGNFSLPAWSDDGRALAVVERKDNGQRWDVSVVRLP